MPPDDGQQSLVTVNQQGVIALNAILQALKAIFPVGTGTSDTATAGAIGLPANATGFINVTLPDGTQAKVAYYDP
jgi:hypothetical protein